MKQTTFAEESLRFTLPQLFWQFFQFGCMAWGGPVAQIEMMRQELVEKGKGWVTQAHFNRILGLYQILPGPEATELAVYFGTVKRGTMGGILTGLGFILPGFLLMLLLSSLYIRLGLNSPTLALFFMGLKLGIVALMIRATHRLGRRAAPHPFLMAVALLCLLLTLAKVHFIPTLLMAGFLTLLFKQHRRTAYEVAAVVFLGILLMMVYGFSPSFFPAPELIAPAATLNTPSLVQLFTSGLRSGLFTFGGAYTVIPYLQHDAVIIGQWMTLPQFLDGLALSGILPAPLIIFATFIGYVTKGLWGALFITFGIFLPAFALTLVGHEPMEKIVNHPRIRSFLDGVTAGVVGLILFTLIGLIPAIVKSATDLLLVAAALFILYKSKHSATVVPVILGTGILYLLIKVI